MSVRIPAVGAIFLALCVAMLPLAGCSSEHPHAAAADADGEHPDKEHPEEHPESGESHLTVDELADAIVSWVAAESAKTGGKLEVMDPVQKKTLKLTLAKVHRDKLSTVAPQTHFVCADFTGADGATYDIDIFMKGPDKDHLETTELSVHKKDGKERYTWHEKDGVWVKSSEAGHEHPEGEHPKDEHPKEEHPKEEHPKKSGEGA